MIWTLGILLTMASLAFLFALFFGKPSKDEPIEREEMKVMDLEDFEIHWHKKENV